MQPDSEFFSLQGNHQSELIDHRIASIKVMTPSAKTDWLSSLLLVGHAAEWSHEHDAPLQITSRIVKFRIKFSN